MIGVRQISSVLCGILLAIAAESTVVGQSPTSMVSLQVRTADGQQASLDGRVLAETPQSLLLEDRAGRIHQLTATQFTDKSELAEEFSYLDTEQLAKRLLADRGAVGFGSACVISETDHFIICSDASPLYTRFCGRLLEKVHDEFYKLFEESPVNLRPLSQKLPVLVFRVQGAFQEFAQQQHPDTDFSDVPGYYSIRDNQMLVMAASGDRPFRTNSDVVRELKKRPRQVETIVHESVHQLAFNSGLQVRYADHPTWLSEGLAVYFETASGRGSLIWSRPGEPNRTHLPGFRNAVAGEQLRLPLTELLSSDAAFNSADHLAHAYAEGWALVSYLIREERAAFDGLMLKQQTRKPLTGISGDDRLAEVQEVTGKTASELEAAVIRYMSRMRNRR